MIIMPDSELKLYRDVEITGNLHQLFTNAAEREAYFAAHLFRSNVDFSYINPGDPISLEIDSADIYKFNYISFKNKSFENKIIYAKVRNTPDYVNNDVRDITYDIDAYTTWMFDITFEDSELNREHIGYGERQMEDADITDYRIASLFTPEPLNFSDSVKAKRSDRPSNLIKMLDFSNQNALLAPKICVMISQEFDEATSGETTPTPVIVNGMNFARASKAEFFPWSQSGLTGLQNLLNNYTLNNMVSSILGIYVVPSIFDNVEEDASFIYNTSPWTTITIPALDVNNGKLNRFPYRYLRLTDPVGNAKEYRIERFAGGLAKGGEIECKFGIFFTLNNGPQVVLAPFHYDGVTDGTDDLTHIANYNFEEKMVYVDFPQISYNTDGALTYYGNVLRGQALKDTTARELKTPFGNVDMDYGLLGTSAYGVKNAAKLAGSLTNPMAMMTNPLGATAGAVTEFAGNMYYDMSDVQLRKELHKAGQSFLENRNMETVIPGFMQEAAPIYAADEYHASSGSVSALSALQFDRFGFFAEVIQPTLAILGKYDMFLDRYGYNVYRIGVPRVAYYTGVAGNDPTQRQLESPIFNSKNETFCKTMGCHVVAPTEEIAQAIEALFNKGHWFRKQV